MAGSKHFRDVERLLAKCGYTFDRQNAKAKWIYVHDTAADLVVNPGMNEGAARGMARDLQKFLGEYVAKPKRNPTQVREQQRKDRDALAETARRLAAERAEILRRRDNSLAGHGAKLSPAEVTAIAERIEQIEREQREIQRLMAAPITGPHSGIRHAQHQAGGQR